MEAATKKWWVIWDGLPFNKNDGLPFNIHLEEQIYYLIS